MQNQPWSSESPVSSSPLTPALRAGLRRATPADAAVVRDLTRSAYAKWVPVIGRKPRPMTADYDTAVRDHIVDMLCLGGKTVALIEMRLEADHLLIVADRSGPRIWSCAASARGRTRLFARVERGPALYERKLDQEPEALRASRLQSGSGGSFSDARRGRPYEQIAHMIASCSPFALGLQLIDDLLQILGAARETVLVRSLQQ